MRSFRGLNCIVFILLMAAVSACRSDSGDGDSPDAALAAALSSAMGDAGIVVENRIALITDIEAPAVPIRALLREYSAVGLRVLLTNDAIIPLRLYPTNAGVRLEGVKNTRDFLLLHYIARDIACPLAIIRKSDFKVGCGFSAGDHERFFGVPYPGYSDARLRSHEKYPIMIASAVQVGDAARIVIAGAVFEIRPGGASERISAPGDFIDMTMHDWGRRSFLDSRMNSHGDMVHHVRARYRMYSAHEAWVYDERTKKGKALFPERWTIPPEFSHNPMDDSLLAMDITNPLGPDTFSVLTRDGSGLVRTDLVPADSATNPERIYGPAARCGPAGALYRPVSVVSAGGVFAMGEYGRSSARIHDVNGLRPVDQRIVISACSGNSFYMVSRQSGSYRTFVYLLSAGGSSVSEIHSTEDLWEWTAAADGNGLLVGASRVSDGRYIMMEIRPDGSIRLLTDEGINMLKEILPIS